MMNSKGFEAPVAYRQFIFPPKTDQFKGIRTISDIEQVLNYQLRTHQIEPKGQVFKFQTKIIEDNKVIVEGKCQNCDAFLRFVKNSSKQLKLQKCLTYHKHNFKNLPIFKQIMSAVESMFIKTDSLSLKNFCKQRFQITQQQFKVIIFYQNYELKKKTLAGYLQTIRQKNIVKIYPQPKRIPLDARTQQFLKPPIFIYLSTHKMQSLYERFGKIIYLHRFPFLVKKNSQKQKNWFVLVFSTKNNYGNIIFLGFAVCNDLNDGIISVAFNVFFNKFDLKMCQTIVTEQQQIFIRGVNKFKQESKFKGEHLWDKMLDLKQTEPRKNIYTKLILAETPLQFDTIMNSDERKMFKGDQSIKLESFRKRSNKYCFSQIPQTFIGLGIGITHFSDILNIISIKFPVEKDLREFIPQFFSFIQTTKVYKYEEQPGFSEGVPYLEDLSGLIPQRAFIYLQNRLLEVSQCNILNQQKNKVKLEKNTVVVIKKKSEQKKQGQKKQGCQSSIQAGSVMFLNDHDTQVQQLFNPEKISLLCDCLMKTKTGLPCAHILRVCLHYFIPFATQIDSFWFCKHALERIHVRKKNK